MALVSIRAYRARATVRLVHLIPDGIVLVGIDLGMVLIEEKAPTIVTENQFALDALANAFVVLDMTASVGRRDRTL
jgi:hypothetical protein